MMHTLVISSSRERQIEVAADHARTAEREFELAVQGATPSTRAEKRMIGGHLLTALHRYTDAQTRLRALLAACP